MIRTLKQAAGLAAVVGTLGVLGAGCLSRPVETASPTIKTNFTTVVHNQAVDKLDILFMIDNSASMGDKQALLALAVPDMINRLITPNCVDSTGKVLGVSSNGACTMGQIEFPPVHDMHIGVVDSSLGGRGGDQCPSPSPNPIATGLDAHNDDHAHMITRGDPTATDPTMETNVADASAGFLGWFPNVAANMGKTAPPVPIAMASQLIGDFTEMIAGVHEHGCGFEAQNEAWYRFLVQPDPFDHIAINNQKASLVGVDQTILQQRAAFLRPDSLVAVIVVTDENEEVANPLSISGQGWAFENQAFPGSPNNAAPQGTVECKQAVDPNNVLTTGPNSSNCTSCAFVSSADPSFATRCPKDGTAGTNGYLDPSNDSLNVRFFNQKFRFGLFAGYPTSRYVRGLSSPSVPDSKHELDNNSNYVGDQDTNANCVNPLFAQNLPTTSSAELCKLTRGTRTPDLIYYAAIAGVPHQLLQQDPKNPDSPQKDTLVDADWRKITGADPEHYNFDGIDFHMLESEVPRTDANFPGGALPSGGHFDNSGGGDGTSACSPSMNECTATTADLSTCCDKVNGGEWNTNKDDLQFACIFPLAAPKDCTLPQFQGACDCSMGSYTAGSQLCTPGATTQQIYGKAYPSVREMIIAHAMKGQGIVSSLCPIHPTEMGAGDPLFGYRPAVNAIVNRLKNSLGNTCLPQQLTKDSCGNVPCLILVTLQGGKCSDNPGLTVPDPTILQKYQQNQHQQWLASGGQQSGAIDPSTQPTCQLQELSQGGNGAGCPAAVGNFDANGSCANSMTPGWCYVSGAAANGCPQAILFTQGEPPSGSTVSLQCIEQNTSGTTSTGSADGG